MTGWRNSCREPLTRLAARFLPGVLVAALLAAGGGSLFAQGFPRTLDKVQVFSAGAREMVQLTFSHPVEADPIEEHQPGSFSLRFSATGTTLPPNTFKIQEESTIRDYRVVRNQYATTLIVGLRDAGLSLRGRLSFAREGNLLRVALGPAGALGAEDAERDREILAQAKRRIGGEPATAPQAQPPAGEAGGSPAAKAPAAVGAAAAPFEENWLMTLVTMLVALAIVLLVLYGLVYGYNRFLAGRIGGGGGSFPIRHLGSFPIGPKQRVVVLDINGEVVACGVTPSQISFLTRLGSGHPPAQRQPPPAPSPAGAPGGGAAPPPVPVSGGAEPAAPERKAKDPVHQFAETLKEKVRSLKRIK